MRYLYFACDYRNTNRDDFTRNTHRSNGCRCLSMRTSICLRLRWSWCYPLSNVGQGRDRYLSRHRDTAGRRRSRGPVRKSLRRPAELLHFSDVAHRPDADNIRLAWHDNSPQPSLLRTVTRGFCNAPHCFVDSLPRSTNSAAKCYKLTPPSKCWRHPTIQQSSTPKQDTGRKLLFLPTPPAFDASVRVSPSEYCYKVSCRKIKWCGWKKFEDMDYSFWDNTQT